MSNRYEEMNKSFFRRTAKWQCEASIAEGEEEYVPCRKLATHVVTWRHEDGYRETRIYCAAHAAQEEKYWSDMDWRTSVELSDIEDWKLTVSYGGHVAIRVGSSYFAKRRHEASSQTFDPFPISLELLSEKDRGRSRTSKEQAITPPWDDFSPELPKRSSGPLLFHQPRRTQQSSRFEQSETEEKTSAGERPTLRIVDGSQMEHGGDTAKS